MNEELLDKLKTSVAAFNSIGELLGISPSNASLFWKELIQLMKDLGTPTTGINEDDKDKILNFIQHYCDLPDKETGEIYVSYIYDALKEGNFWNESIEDLFKDLFSYTGEDTPLGSSILTSSHLKNANAGLSFVKLPWVEPNFNLDGDVFDEVRGHDSVNDILRNRHKLQYTHTQDQMEIDGKGAYDDYSYVKYYLYPDVTGDNAVAAQIDDSFAAGTDSYNYNDQRLMQVLYDIYNLERDVFKSAFYNSSSIQEAYTSLEEYLSDYTVAEFTAAVNGIATRLGFKNADESTKLQYYYKYIVALFGHDMDLEEASYRIILFVQWCIENKTKLEEEYETTIVVSEKYNTDGTRNGLSSIALSPDDNDIFGEIYKEFCEEHGYHIAYLLVIKNVAQNANALGKYLRLLMPQYGRRVEIEDLNRNFWVIAQVIAGISDFLFDDDAPIPNLFKELSDEIVQLWENVLYLWIEVAVASQKATPTVRILNIPMPNDEERSWRKFDDFEKPLANQYYGFKDAGGYLNICDIEDEDVLQKCKTYVDKYPNENLIIVAHQRLGNYRQNFYSCEYYPEVLCYHCGTQTWKKYDIRMHLQNYLDQEWGAGIDIKNYYVNGCPITLRKLEDSEIGNNFFAEGVRGCPSSIWSASGLNRLESLIGGFIIEDKGYVTFSPCDFSSDEDLCYCAVRCIPHVEYELDSEDLKITDFYIDIYDASAMVRNENYEPFQVAKVVLEDSTEFGAQIGIDEDNKIIYCRMSYLIDKAPTSELTEHNCIGHSVTHQSFYMGEIASYYTDFNRLYFGKVIAEPADDEDERRAHIQSGTLSAGGQGLAALADGGDVSKSLFVVTSGNNSIGGNDRQGTGYSYWTKDGLIYDSTLVRYNTYHSSTDGGIAVMFNGQIVEQPDFIFNTRDWYEYYGYDTEANKYYSNMTQIELYASGLYSQFFIRVTYLIYIHSLDSEVVDMAFLVPSDYMCTYNQGVFTVSQKQVLDLSGVQQCTSGQDWRSCFDLGQLETFGSAPYYTIHDLTSLTDSRLQYADNFQSISDSVNDLSNNDSGFCLTEDGDLYVAKTFFD